MCGGGCFFFLEKTKLGEERWRELEEGDAGTSGGGGQVEEVEVEEGSLVAVAACLSARFTVAGYLLVSVVAW